MKDTIKWFLCPHCGKRVLKYDEIKGKSKKLFIKCKSCKEEIEINIE